MWRGDSCRESSLKQPSCIASGLPVPEGVCSCSQTYFFPLLWGEVGLGTGTHTLSVLRLADSVQDLLKGVDCLSRKMPKCRIHALTHSTPPPCPPLSHTPVSLPSSLTFLSLMHSLVHLNKSIEFCIQFHGVGRLPGAPGWPHLLDPWTPGINRTVPLRARNTESLAWIFYLGRAGKCWNYLACPGEINFTCVRTASSPCPHLQRAGSQRPREQSPAHQSVVSQAPAARDQGEPWPWHQAGVLGALAQNSQDSPWGWWMTSIVTMWSLFALRSLAQMFWVTERLPRVFAVVPY